MIVRIKQNVRIIQGHIIHVIRNVCNLTEWKFFIIKVMQLANIIATNINDLLYFDTFVNKY